jgi:hypothetical protein
MKEQFESLQESKFQTFEPFQILNSIRIQGGITVRMSSRSGQFDTAEPCAAAGGGSQWDDTQWHANGSHNLATSASNDLSA